MTSRRTKISPKSGRGLGHMISTIFGSTVGYPSDSLASCYIQLQLCERNTPEMDQTNINNFNSPHNQYTSETDLF